MSTLISHSQYAYSLYLLCVNNNHLIHLRSRCHKNQQAGPLEISIIIPDCKQSVYLASVIFSSTTVPFFYHYEGHHISSPDSQCSAVVHESSGPCWLAADINNTNVPSITFQQMRERSMVFHQGIGFVVETRYGYIC